MIKTRLMQVKSLSGLQNKVKQLTINPCYFRQIRAENCPDLISNKLNKVLKSIMK